MCGIAGVVGLNDCAETLLDLFQRLEYRGYDSSGIVTQTGAEFNVRRAVGKLRLSAALRDAPLEGRSGIGHTRWATHGGVSERNAHPHIADQKVAIVHNGIIENHASAQGVLDGEKGHEFSSETDSEILAHLFLEAFNMGMDARKAGTHVLSQIEGTFAFAAMHVDQPDVMIVARNASPLAVGIGDGVVLSGLMLSRWRI